ncbi:FAD-dependent tricarballylate dehydrogenase TcuA [Thermomicrobiaceae bacterium CFH 74404]|uniref:FAD-dependent tricarballylate dehydrogenase TcuA n=1 Tax=Thermalbibacter longus TaxID=2951981 RepID=A0AA41WDF9_9BACT|nr:FAD-dependent tricarballylate dehydrogenase TcuA [Thermalbibacter longus]MCM8748494.1 FAD-dependent tricarballylate dehydrogenase TcuA [Thermalbibacter longus]
MNAAAYDAIVVGSGNAGFCAAHAARECGARVLLVEKAPREWAGGNSAFTAGAIRTTYHSLDDLRPLLADPGDERLERTELPPYTPDDFLADLRRVTEGRCDPELSEILVHDIAGTVRWLYDLGLRYVLLYERQAYLSGGRYRFWGGLVLGAAGEGVGLIEAHARIAERNGVEIRYETAAVDLLLEDGHPAGLVCVTPAGREEIRAGAVVLAAGGFEADPRLRAMYLGSGWDLARVRGTPYNTGEALQAALALGAQPAGHWSGCHSIAWDAQSPPHGDRTVRHRYSRQSYPLGIVVNRHGQRFLDEGADFRNYTYARYGAEILKQPGALAWQIFDAKTAPLLQADYRGPEVTRVEAGSLRELAERAGIDPEGLERTVEAFNAAVQPGAFDPAVKDGKRTAGIVPPKSNWALPLDTPPYLAFPVTCGITFTYGGLRIDGAARVLDRSGRPIPGLFAAGELVGGLFYHNYPGGSGLAAGAVFGRQAGRSAAEFARQRAYRPARV